MKLGKSVEIKVSKCTNCGDALDRASGINNDSSPSPGNATVCLHCGHIMAYDNDLSLRELTDKEIIEVAGDKSIVEFQRVRGYVFKDKK